MLNKLGSRFNLHCERCFLERMTKVFSRSKIVFNNSIKDDLNMRVFEAMASGSLLLTDEAKGSGLIELFQDRKHLVIYRDEKELLELTDYYLRNDDERERIAEEGMREVLNRHTYKHRISEMLSIIFPFPSMDAKDRDYFSQERKDIEALIPEDTMRILEVGCGEGILGKRLLDKGAKEVIGIEINPEIYKRAVRNLSGVICGDIEELELPFDPQFFNCIIFADVLEHLRDPQLALKKLKNYLSPSGTVVASIPNVRYYGVIDMVVEGRWKYEDCGILDKTHLRFFTKKEIESLFNGAGLEIIGITENIDPAYYSLNDPLSGEISFGRVSLKGLSPEELKDLFVGQYLIKAQKAGHEIQKVYNTMKSALESGNLEEANRALEEYLDAHPADTDILYRHADLCCKLGLSDKARESLERLLIFEPEREDALELRGKLEAES
jgi:2-polyprenyl-3-methyl-5-hydroxy-6-metoxy-1,4-benzoquinol methylase